MSKPKQLEQKRLSILFRIDMLKLTNDSLRFNRDKYDLDVADWWLINKAIARNNNKIARLFKKDRRIKQKIEDNDYFINQLIRRKNGYHD